jgi:pilus assembly protein CpaF
MVNGSGDVYVEREGRLVRTKVRFANESDVRHLIERVVAPLGLRVDITSPWVDARLADGSRFHVVLPPIALGGPVVTIRKFADAGWTFEDLIARDAISDDDAVRLVDAVRSRDNVLVSGGGGTGKTTLLGTHRSASSRSRTRRNCASARGTSSLSRRVHRTSRGEGR